MSKQLLTSDPPAATAPSIGNYKGVMLCNRPNDPGATVKQQGKGPFISRVTPLEQLGLTPSLKVTVRRAKGRNLEILNRHKKWLLQLQQRKTQLTEVDQKKALDDQEKRRKIAEQAAKKRQLILGQEDAPKASPPPENPVSTLRNSPPAAPVKKLTTENLRAHTREMDRKPKWALTQEAAVEQEEAEVDDLLDFANSLDYDEIINDLEVRQALEILKDRVEELKQDQDWKEKIVKTYNQDAKSAASAASMKSIRSKVTEKLAEEAKKDPDQLSEGAWEKNTRGDQQSVTAEEKIAKLMADQILENNPVRTIQQFKKIHSNLSIRRLLEREAKKQLELGPRPVISIIKENATLAGREDPSNLPYLHRNPAV